MQASAIPLAIISSAIQASVIRPTVATGMLTRFLIWAASSEWVPILVPGAGMELPRLMVVPPDTWIISTPAFFLYVFYDAIYYIIRLPEMTEKSAQGQSGKQSGEAAPQALRDSVPCPGEPVSTNKT